MPGIRDNMRSMSPLPGSSIFTTSAPKSASIIAAAGAAMTEAASTTRRPENRCSIARCGLALAQTTPTTCDELTGMS